MLSQAPQSLALAVGIGAVITVACRRAKIPALLPLLGVGLLFGTSGLGVVNASSLGDSLRAIITVSIGLLIFEGTLHLNRQELGHAPRAVWGLLTIGAVTTMGGVAAAAHWILEFGWPVSILLGATLIVTGPTVVQPILRMMRVSPRLNAALGAEAILIDAIGVIATVTTLEVLRAWLRSGVSADLATQGLVLFGRPMISGVLLGLLFGIVGYASLRSASKVEAISSHMSQSHAINLIAIGVSMTCVGVGEAIAPEAGLVAVTICGLIMAQAKVLGGTELRAFKELLATLLVGTLFILLASRFDIENLRNISWREAAFLGALLLVVRPISVNLSAWRSALTARERAFASVFAPRGVVALAVASIAGTELAKVGSETASAERSADLASVLEQARRLEPVVFVAISGTVLAATLLSPILARVLGVRAGRGNAVLIVGAHKLGVELARALKEAGIGVRLVDSSTPRVTEAMAQGLDAIEGDATDTRWLDDVATPHEAGWVIAWTGNDSVDRVVARWCEQRFGGGRSILWPQKEAPAELAGSVIGGTTSRAQVTSQVSRGTLRIEVDPEREKFSMLLGWVHRGVLGFALPQVAEPKPGPEVRFIGLATRAPAATTVPVLGSDDSTRDEFALQ